LTESLLDERLFWELDDIEILSEKAEEFGPPMFPQQRAAHEAMLEEAVLKGLQALQKAVVKEISKGEKELESAKSWMDIADQDWFWENIKSEYEFQTSKVVETLIQAGVTQPASLGVVYDFSLANTAARQAADAYSDDWWNQLTANTRFGLRRAIENQIISGKPLKVLTDSLSSGDNPLFSPARAKMIAATETTRMYAEGNRAAYAAGGIQTVEWRTSRDSHVCDICGPLHGQRMILGHEDYVPPAHPRCRCHLAPVVENQALTKPKRLPKPSGKLGNVKLWDVLNDPHARTTFESNKEMWNTLSNKVAPGSTPEFVDKTLKKIVCENLEIKLGLSAAEARSWIHSWAMSSSDHQSRSLAMQKAAADKFNLPINPFIQAKLNRSPYWIDYTDIAKKVVDSIYEDTQAFLKENGIKSMKVVRGERDTSLYPEESRLYNPLSSHTVDETTPNQFGDKFYTVEVPASRIFSLPFTGIGCFKEYEVVVIGGHSYTTPVSLESWVDAILEKSLKQEGDEIDWYTVVTPDQEDWLKTPSEAMLLLNGVDTPEQLMAYMEENGMTDCLLYRRMQIDPHFEAKLKKGVKAPWS